MIKLYITFVQKLLARQNVDVTAEAFEMACQMPDHAQEQLSDINRRRDDIVTRLRRQKFECPEVPEAMESQRACPKCRGTDLMATSRQTRGADEPATVFYACLNDKCGYNFR